MNTSARAGIGLSTACGTLQATTPARTTKVARNRYGEFVVKFFEGGVHLKEADYFAADREDADGTARAWEKPSS